VLCCDFDCDDVDDDDGASRSLTSTAAPTDAPTDVDDKAVGEDEVARDRAKTAA